MKPHGAHHHSRKTHPVSKKVASSQPEPRPRQLAPAVMGRRMRSRHTAFKQTSASLQQWLSFARNRAFWVIGGVVTAVTLTVLWEIKDLPALPRVDWAALKAMQNWKPTFFIRQEPAVVENGKVVQPAETYYTVPSKLVEPPPKR